MVLALSLYKSSGRKRYSTLHVRLVAGLRYRYVGLEEVSLVVPEVGN